ncbi:STAS domain-containing protein [Streptomyces cocklensis]|uniref:Anti-anti-sigma factor n=1 Tax=Actinacidiphila cocklensis TaxID=887465 RepID=A0A9W4DZL4_9ACTN|nr:STAS domain-containing protein [Actinacidiphila cocklensis]MDD1058780.1 STAS domain-containing protein [Actinacidiphila cocklensis]WSX75016.1 STAS domain-containing protein [Streptomyces sp. NBC_00899]CAG6398898.1 Anti-anti-sigma factor [Actinacidiphila cocklensis]
MDSGDGVEAGVYYSEPYGSVWVIALHGEFDLDTLSVVQSVTEQALAAFDGPLVFDLAMVAFCDSALLNHLVRTASRRRTALAHPGAAVSRLLQITGAEAVFSSYEDLVNPTADPDQ